MRDEDAVADRKVFETAAGQEGVITRAQALAAGLSSTRIRRHLGSGRWQRIHRGVYATFSGRVARPSLLWAAVLWAGPGAMLSHESAAEMWGLVPPSASRIHVIVPAERVLVRNPGIVVRRSKASDRARHPSRLPWMTRIEETVIDLTQTAIRLEDAQAWLARAVGGRFTTAPRLQACIERRPRVRWRAALVAALGDVAAGSHSWLELAYLRDVERAHGLPRARRQVRRDTGHYDDVRYQDYRVRVELDGRAAHPLHERWRDMRRDNAAAVKGDHVLRYGSGDVSKHPCEVAAELASVLRIGGWPGPARPCGRPACVIPP